MAVTAAVVTPDVMFHRANQLVAAKPQLVAAAAKPQLVDVQNQLAVAKPRAVDC